MTHQIGMEGTHPLQNSPVQIGPISLQGFEVPESIRFGGRQRLTVHRLCGGRRVVERLGPDDGEIVFHGTISGPNAEARALAFDNLRISGAVVWLSWETFRRRVVIKTFTADYHSPWWIPYRVSCVVAYQEGVASAGATTGFALITADIGNAIAAVSGSAISFTQLQTAISKPNATTIGTSNQVQAVTAAQNALDTVNQQITLQSASLTEALSDPCVDPQRSSRALVSAVTSAGLLAGAVVARSYIGRIGVTLSASGN